MRKIYVYILGLASGVLNGLFGSGGGIIVVPMLERLKIPAKKAHATSVAIILPLCTLSIAVYMVRGVRINLISTFALILFGLLGTFIGTKLLKKIPNSLLRRIFGAIMIYSGLRLLIK